MRDEGFTIIELTAIVVVLVAIFLLVFPSFIKIASKDDEKKYEEIVDTLCLAGRTYIYSNTDKFIELSNVGYTIKISVEDLIPYSNMNSDLKNPNTDKSIINDTVSYVVKEDYSLECKYLNG